MPARWGSFAIGLALGLAPLVLGYASATTILHDVAMGLLVSVAALPSLEWPRARFAMAVPALWLVYCGSNADDPRAAAAELGAGALLLALTLVRSGRRIPRSARLPGPADVSAARSAL